MAIDEDIEIILKLLYVCFNIILEILKMIVIFFFFFGVATFSWFEYVSYY